jgi:hypothetical protein
MGVRPHSDPGGETVVRPSTWWRKVLDRCGSPDETSGVNQAKPAPAAAREEQGSPPALHDRAIDNLTFIRQAMERAGSFTAVSGTGIVIIGLIAVIAGLIADRQAAVNAWFAVWIAAAVAAVVIELTLTARKARALGLPIDSGPGRQLSVPVVPVMGASFMAAGGIALLLPASQANWMMVAGFGLLHIVFGFFIARRYGG